MSLFELLIIAHLLGDYLFQTEYEALNKAQGSFFNRPLWQHVATYTACFVPLCIWVHLPWLSLVAIAGSHAFFDRRWPIIWWRKNIMGNSPESITEQFWLTIMVDQIFHILVLTVLVIFSRGI